MLTWWLLNWDWEENASKWQWLIRIFFVENITLASELTAGLVGNWTSVALSMVFSSNIVACDWLCPNGFFPVVNNTHTHTHKRKKQLINCFQCHFNGFCLTGVEITVKTLIKDDSDAPDVDFGGYFRWCLANDETFGRQVPISAGALRRQIHSVLRIVIVLVHDLRQAEIRDLDITAYAAVAQQDVARLQVVVDDGRFDLVQVFQSRYHLSYYRSISPINFFINNQSQCQLDLYYKIQKNVCTFVSPRVLFSTTPKILTVATWN